MKRILYLFFILFFAHQSYAHTPKIGHEEPYTILKHSDEKGDFVYEVIAQMGVNIIPSVAQGICLLTVKNPRICQGVHFITEAIVQLGEDQIKEGIEYGLKYVVERAIGGREARIHTKTMEEAYAVVAVLQEYRRRQYAAWNNIHSNAESLHKGELFLINTTCGDLNFQLEIGDGQWLDYTVCSGCYKFCDLKNIPKNYISARIGTNGVYEYKQLYLGRKYSIRDDTYNKKYTFSSY